MIDRDANLDHTGPRTNGAEEKAKPAAIPVERAWHTVLQNTSEGVFFLDSQYTILTPYSRAAREMLSVENFDNSNFIALLENRIPEQIIENVREYLSLMFREDLDDDVIAELNPLSRIEFFFEDDWGLWTSSKFLSFRFNKIMVDNGVQALLVIVKDNSEAVQLKNRLKENEEHTQKQMEWLVNILHVEPDLLDEFFQGVEKELQNIDRILKYSKTDTNYLELLENIYRSSFIIKGNASLLNLNFFSQKASAFLDKVLEIKKKADIEAGDFVTVVVQLGELRKTLQEVREISQRIHHFHIHFRAKRSYESELLVNSLKSLVGNLSQQLGKKVRFNFVDFDALSIPYTLRNTVRDILFLLIRNAILYSIEHPSERLSLEKSAHATIQISSYLKQKSLEVVLRHDGKIEKIESVLQNLVTPGHRDNEEFQKTAGSNVSKILFMPDLPQGREDDLLQNYSMDIEMLKKKLKENGGRLKITFTTEKYCDFIVTLPLNHKTK